MLDTHDLQDRLDVMAQTVTADVETPSAQRNRTALPACYAWARDLVVGESDAIRKAIALAHEAGTRGAPVVLVTGETGTGKELFARGVHACGTVARGPFLQVHCAALSSDALTRELFGCDPSVCADVVPPMPERGLLELAAGGTLMLDEIDALSPVLQDALLHVLEHGTFCRVGSDEKIPLTARLVVTSMAPLEDAVDDGIFSLALYERVSAVRVDIPPVRERGDDVALLARYVLDRIARDSGATPLKLSAEAINALHGHLWPGNVRELRKVVERAALVCTGDTVQRRHLMFQRRRVLPDAGEVETIIQIPSDGKSLEAITNEAIHVTLVLTQGNLSATARILGISRPTLARKMRDAGVLRRSIFAVS